jgi:hypothetical protein
MHVLVLPRGYDFDFYLMCLSVVRNSTKHFPMAGVMDLPSAQIIDSNMHASLLHLARCTKSSSSSMVVELPLLLLGEAPNAWKQVHVPCKVRKFTLGAEKLCARHI